MLHRGKYAIATPETGGVAASPATPTLRERFRLKNILKFDDDFTFTDKLASAGIFWWAIFLLLVNVVVTIWNLFFHAWPITWWSHYWMVAGVGIPFVIGIGTLIWFGAGGIKDILDFFQALRTMTRDVHDDGSVKRAVPAAAPAPSELPVAPAPAGDNTLKAGAAVGAPPIA
jgi:hypothetical protein